MLPYQYEKQKIETVVHCTVLLCKKNEKKNSAKGIETIRRYYGTGTVLPKVFCPKILLQVTVC